MTEISFYLSDKDTERLFEIKRQQGADNLTGNEFARQLLENELFRLCPRVPRPDEAGEP